jgi:hypothetical protein
MKQSVCHYGLGQRYFRQAAGTMSSTHHTFFTDRSRSLQIIPYHTDPTVACSADHTQNRQSIATSTRQFKAVRSSELSATELLEVSQRHKLS